MRRALHAVNLGLCGLLLFGSLWLYPALPEEIPRHFGFSGTADAYWNTSLAHWLLFPLIGMGVAAMLYGIAWLLGRAPPSISVPNQAEFDALDRHSKRLVVQTVQAYLHSVAFGVLVLFSVSQAGIYQAAVTGSGVLPTYALGALVAFLVGLAGGTVWLVWKLPRQVRRYSDDG